MKLLGPVPAQQDAPLAEFMFILDKSCDEHQNTIEKSCSDPAYITFFAQASNRFQLVEKEIFDLPRCAERSVKARSTQS